MAACHCQSMLPLLVLAREGEILGLQFFRLILYLCKSHTPAFIAQHRFEDGHFPVRKIHRAFLVDPFDPGNLH